MKKHIITLFILLATALAAAAQQKTVELSQAGTLAQKLTPEEQTTLTEIVVKGQINYLDIELLSKMSKEYQLLKIDLSQALWEEPTGKSYPTLGASQEQQTLISEQNPADEPEGVRPTRAPKHKQPQNARKL